MRILVTGARGFIGKNLVVRLQEASGHEIIPFSRGDAVSELPRLLGGADAVVHLAGVNRPADIAEFATGNTELTEALCEAMAGATRRIPLIMTSSRHAATADAPGISDFHRAYGRSKRDAERAVEQLAESGTPVVIYRLPGVFGKWCRPNYNSVVATFCHNVANGLPIQVNDPAASLQLVYVDDVLDEIMRVLAGVPNGLARRDVAPEYGVTLGELASRIRGFRQSRESLVTDRVGAGLTRALYATYVSYLPPRDFAYDLTGRGDARGMFAEVLKTVDSGQFSFFTAHPGVTRGGHYHHTKTEKFIVMKGKARFGFRHILTGERHHIDTSGDAPQVVETVPGWAHDVTNIGNDEMVVMLWANEIFDRDKPDTVMAKVEQ